MTTMLSTLLMSNGTSSQNGFIMVNMQECSSLSSSRFEITAASRRTKAIDYGGEEKERANEHKNYIVKENGSQ